MGSVFTVLVALGLMTPPVDIDDRRNGQARLTADNDRFREHKNRLLMHGLTLVLPSTPLSRALGEDELIAAQNQPSAYERELEDAIRQYHARIGTLTPKGRSDD